MAKILIVEDDRLLSDLLGKFLAAQNHATEQVYDGVSALAQLQAYKYDLIILDWNLPGSSGIEVVTQLKQRRPSPPVLMLTSRAQTGDKVQGLEAGADDYMAKPVGLQEFGARVRALLRRLAVQPDKVLTYKDLVFEPDSGKARRGNRQMALPRKESELLGLLMQHTSDYISAEALLERLWGTGGSRASLANCLKRLRQQLNQDGEPDLIETAHGLGYKLK